MLGKHQPVILQLLELEPAMKALEGVIMELKDCAFPLLHGVTASSDVNKAFEGADFAMLVGAKPRTKGMERGDLLKENANIFSIQGKVPIAIVSIYSFGGGVLVLHYHFLHTLQSSLGSQQGGQP